MGMKFCILLATCFMATPSFAETFTSGPQRVSLLELYTSEGCSSCPPAETWLSDLQNSNDIWKKFVPIAFHVTYWNYLGWTDAASQEAFNDRQRQYAASWKSGSVYTPCFVRNGEEWHRDGKLAANEEKIGTLTVKTTANQEVEVSFQTGTKADYVVHLAEIGGQVETKIRAGENAGRTLRHDFVALSLQETPLLQGDIYVAKLTLPPFGKNAPTETGLVAWITKSGELTPIQATGGFFAK